MNYDIKRDAQRRKQSYNNCKLSLTRTLYDAIELTLIYSIFIILLTLTSGRRSENLINWLVEMAISKKKHFQAISYCWLVVFFRQDNGSRSNQESKFDFLATRQRLVKIDEEQ